MVKVADQLLQGSCRCKAVVVMFRIYKWKEVAITATTPFHQRMSSEYIHIIPRTCIVTAIVLADRVVVFSWFVYGEQAYVYSEYAMGSTRYGGMDIGNGVSLESMSGGIDDCRFYDAIKSLGLLSRISPINVDPTPRPCIIYPAQHPRRLQRLLPWNRDAYTDKDGSIREG